MTSTSIPSTPTGSVRPSPSSRVSVTIGSRSLEAGEPRNTVPDEHLEEIEAIKRYEVCQQPVLWRYQLFGSSGCIIGGFVLTEVWGK